MCRNPPGTYVEVATAGERLRAFVPVALPPAPPLAWPALRRPRRHAGGPGSARRVSTLLPNPALFLYTYVRKEAVLSSQIEGTQSSLSDLLLFELDEAPGVPLDDVREVSQLRRRAGPRPRAPARAASRSRSG